MTEEANGGTELIVLGRDEEGKPQAARFPAGHHGLVAKAAKAMGLTVCTAESADAAESAKKLPPGRCMRGRGFVPAVGRGLYGKRLQGSKLAGQPVPDETDQPMATGQPRRSRPRSAEQLGRLCCGPPSDRPGGAEVAAGGGHRVRPRRRHVDPEMA